MRYNVEEVDRFLKDLDRLCDSHTCYNCPLHESPSDKTCRKRIVKNSLHAMEVVDKWVTDNPVRTYAMDFFEKFPNARRNIIAQPFGCCGDVYNFCCNHENTCKECWNQEMEDK